MPGPADCAELLRALARELKARGRWPELAPGQDPAQVAACLERAAQALAPAAQAAPPLQAQPPQEPRGEPPALLRLGPWAPGPLTLFADGGSRGNPGPAGAGAALFDAAGEQVAAWHRYLGRATNNVAEYQALIMGLEGALELGVRELGVRLDSELLVRQMTGAYQVKSAHLKPLFEQARALARRFVKIGFQHIPRHLNSVADGLANLAMDQG